MKNSYTPNKNRIVRVHDDHVDELLDTIAKEMDVPYQQVFNAFIALTKEGKPMTFNTVERVKREVLNVKWSR